MVYILLGSGFEEAEALVPADLLRRAGIGVALVGLNGTEVTGAHAITVKADISIDQVSLAELEMLVLPGGMGGVTAINACPKALELIQSTAGNGNAYLAAICAAPSVVLGPLGLLRGRRATCYPEMESGMIGALPCSDASVVVDGKIITGMGPGAAFDFGLKLVECLAGAETAQKVRNDACYRR